MKIRFLVTALISAAVVAGTAAAFDAFAANSGEDLKIQQSSGTKNSASDVQRRFVCEAEGCLRTGVHEHTLCSIPDCTEASVHVHDGICYYAHSVDDGHAYHICGVDGCALAGEHTHNSCGVIGCDMMESHSHHNGNSGGSGHHSRHGGHH